MKIRKISNRILAYTLTLAILLSSLVFGAVTTAAEDTEIAAWSGNAADSFAGGDGSAATPYLIETAEQLRLLVTSYCSADYETGNFKLTKDIYLNNVVDGAHVKSLADKKNWAEGLAEGTKANSFYGTLDGDGHTIYGLYAFGESAALGLLPAINNATVIKNLNFDNLYINGADSSGAAIAGAAKYYTWQKTAQISYCSVTNAVIGQGGNMEFAAGLVADAQDAKVNFSNCYVKDSTFSDWSTGAGIIANDWGKGITLNNCYTVDIYPVRSSVASATATNVYTNVAAPEGNVTANIVTLTDDQMKGDAAKENMAGFDFVGTWQTVEGGYPVIRDEIIGVWDGTKDYNLEGSGTEADPYLVKTAAHLAAIATGNNGDAFTGKYFKLANDIRINDTTSANWKDSARGWVWADFRFVGTFDGDGHTIDGLYYNGSQRVMGLFSYVGADNNGVYKTTLKNFNMTNAYIESTAADGAGFAAGQASRVAYFDGIYIDDTCEINATSTGVGGILGQSGYNVFMSNIAMNGKVVGGSNVGAFAGTLSSGARLDIKSSYTTADLYAQGVTDRNLADASGAVYALKKEGTVDAVVTVLTADQMKGENAKTYMTGFSFKYIWETVENDYPVYNPRGELWDGSYVTDFSTFKGSGTAEDPYLIENGAQLAFAMVKNSKLNAGTCYKLAKDIILNDTSFVGWQSSARSWPHQTANRWVGTLDGDGHTIEGLYMNTATKRPGLVSYSQGTFKNLVFSGASINYTGASEPGVAIIAAQTSGATSFENIYIDETCEINATAVKGVAALAGRGYDSTGNISITNCAVLANINTEGTECGALTGSQWVSGITVKISNCYSTSSKPLFGYATKALTADSGNNYSIVEDTHGTTVLTLDQMKGEAAKANMLGFDFYGLWKTTDSYPVFRDMDDRMESWDGTKAESFAGGNGTIDNPYQIANGAQLYKMVAEYSNADVTVAPETQTYFRITADINLGGKKWYTNSLWKDDLTSANYTTGFNGVVYGDGHIIYGLTVNGTDAYSNVGLIPIATQGAEIHDLHLVGGYLKQTGWNGRAVGALIGMAVGVAGSEPIVIEGCSVKDFNIQSENGSAAFVAYSYSQSINIKDCYVVDSAFTHTGTDATSNSGAFIAVMRGSAEYNSVVIENSYYCGDVSPKFIEIDDEFGEITTFKNVYTTNEAYDGSVEGLTKLSDAEMKAKLAGFNYNQVWQTAQDGYSVHLPYAVQKTLCNGTEAASYAGGTGTEADPYLISDAQQLYKLANATREETLGKFYKLTNDITISRVYDGWSNDNLYTWAVKKAYLEGFTYASSFAGTLDGAGHTVGGIYYNNEITDNGDYAYGLIPFATANAVVKDITVSDINASVTGNGAAVGGVVGAAHVTPEDAENPLNFIQFVGVNVKNCSANAAYTGDIVGRATHGIKFEICNADSIIGNYTDNIFMNGCNEALTLGDNVLIYNALNADSKVLEVIRAKLIGTTDAYITDINATHDFNIADLVSAYRNIVAAAEDEYELVWSQDFNNNTMDYSVWSQNTTMSRKTNLVYGDNATVNGGSLKLNNKDTGEVDENGNKIYSVSYGLSTVDTMSFKYGRLEMRAKVPFGAGAFPSLWLTSRNALGNGVSPYGYDNEIDIFEVFGKSTSQDRMITCMHKWYVDENGNRIKDAQGNSIECSNGTGVLSGNGSKIDEADRSHKVTEAGKTAWHTIVFEWTEDTMTFTVDGESYDIKLSQLGDFDLTGYDTDSEGLFNQFMYLRLNNHMYTVGGSTYVYGGSESDIDPNKLTYEIDYIKLYQKDNGEINLK
ncbi:MAG: glycoside hydrolase family 16 protein [Clostridia bacterium]|nr:glycoside hydrolase family 16 protein [Clostridia bacterium]